jgi:hypothetical protein
MVEIEIFDQVSKGVGENVGDPTMKVTVEGPTVAIRMASIGSNRCGDSNGCSFDRF